MNTATQTSQTNPTTPNIDKTTWESRIRDSAVFLGLSIEEVTEALKELGVEKEPAGLEMLSDESITPFGDLMKVFGDARNIPIAKVRLAAKHLRGPKDSAKTDTLDPDIIELKQKYGFKLKIQDADPADLLQYYHPEQPNHPVTQALKKRFGSQPIIIFKPDSKSVNIEETANYIMDLEQGYPEQKTIEVDGILVRIYPVGQVPNKMIDEDPLFKGHPLKRERSLINRINWNGIGEDVRQFCRLIVDNDEIDVNNKIEIRSFMKIVNKGIKELSVVYPEVDLQYRELKQKNELPKLHISLEDVPNKENNPFGIKNRQY